jgi:hypothetical protein
MSATIKTRLQALPGAGAGFLYRRLGSLLGEREIPGGSGSGQRVWGWVNCSHA